MWKRKKRQGGEIVYLSRQKLEWLMASFGIRVRAWPSREVEGGATVEVALPPFAKASLGGRLQGAGTEWAGDASLVHEALEQVLKHLRRLPDLERGDLIREGEWFRFHRNLKFGVGHADAEPAVNALVAVDRSPLPAGSPQPALLMNGSVAHVLDPYATEELRSAKGSRSGSGTDRLFNWLEEVRRRGEDDPGASWRAVVSASREAPKGSDTVVDMYRLFSREDWLAPFLAEPLMHGAPCEGVARASFISIGDEGAIVMGSPLFVRLSPLPD